MFSGEFSRYFENILQISAAQLVVISQRHFVLLAGVILKDQMLNGKVAREIVLTYQSC